MLRSSDSNLRDAGNPARLPVGSDMITVAPLWRMDLREREKSVEQEDQWRWYFQERDVVVNQDDGVEKEIGGRAFWGG